jgi:hypothetical protein
MQYLYREPFDHKPALHRVRYRNTIGFPAPRRWLRPFSVIVFETVTRVVGGV